MAGPSLSLLVLKTRDVERLRRFYAALGIDFVEERHGSGPIHHAGRVGDLTLEVYPLPEGDGVPDATTRLGFRVPDLLEAVQAVEALGARVASRPQPTEWGFRAVVRDPDGRAVELSQ